MSRINTNIPALRAIRLNQVNQGELGLRLERLSTGLRINRGRDDPAGLIASEALRSEIRTIQQAIENSTRANNVISTAEGAIQEVSALLLELQSLVVATANEGGLLDEEVRANQLAVDSILDSIDRIGNTTSFGSEKLLDGSRAYILSAVPPSQLASVSVFAARLPAASFRDVQVRVTQSAQTAQVSYVGATAGGTSTTSATTIEVRGPSGGHLLSFASGTTLSEIRSAINNVLDATGVSAVVSAASGGIASALVLNSTSLGSEAFVSVTPITGNFIAAGNGGIELRDTGVDAGVLVDGQPADVKGLRADVRAGGLDARIYLTQSFGQTLSSITFSITGGGMLFQITPELSSNGTIAAAFDRISATSLGNSVTGWLYTLRSGTENDFTSKNFATAQAIVEEAVSQVAFYRGRLGSIQKDFIDPSIDSQRVTLENVTASESIIRDADMAVEVSALTRAQVLVQSTQTTLQIANSVPRMVLALLG